jgi:hypothetical protein
VEQTLEALTNLLEVYYLLLLAFAKVSLFLLHVKDFRAFQPPLLLDRRRDCSIFGTCHMRRRIHACHMRRRIHACHTCSIEEETVASSVPSTSGGKNKVSAGTKEMCMPAFAEKTNVCRASTRCTCVYVCMYIYVTS